MPEEIREWFIKSWNISREDAEQLWASLSDAEKQMYLGAYRLSDLGKRAPPFIPGKVEPPPSEEAPPVEETPPEEVVELDPTKVLPSDVLKSLQQSESLEEVDKWLQTYINEGRITATQADEIGMWVEETTRIPRERERITTEAERKYAREKPQAEAFFQRFQEERPEVSEIAKTLPAMPSAAGVSAPFLEKMSPAMRQYYEQRMGDIYGEFGGAAARQPWWEAMHAPPVTEKPPGAELGDLIPSLRQQAFDWWERAKTAPTDELYGGVAFGPGGMKGMAETAARTATRKLGEAMAEREKLMGELEYSPYEPPAPRPKPQDPWAGYLQTYPFLEKFMGQAPRQRGFFPSTYRPPTRWLGFG